MDPHKQSKIQALDMKLLRCTDEETIWDKIRY